MGRYINLFTDAEYTNLEPNSKKDYEDSLKYYRDLKGALDTSFKKGKIEKIEKLRKEIEKKPKP